MATEEPQTLPVDQKTKGSEEVKDVAVDDPTAPVVNGYAHTPPPLLPKKESLFLTCPTCWV